MAGNGCNGLYVATNNQIVEVERAHVWRFDWEIKSNGRAKVWSETI